MRRLLAILLLLSSSLPLVSSLLVADISSNENLPVCCRRDGAHHCMEQAAFTTGTRLTTHSKCPLWPTAIAGAANHIDASLLVKSAYFSGPPHTSTSISSAVVFSSNSIQQNRHLRGPPSQLSPISIF